MKAMSRLPKYSMMINRDFYVSNNNNVIKRSQDEALHEHDFVPVDVKELNGHHLIIKCVTCNKYYCHLCGIALTDEEMQYILNK